MGADSHEGALANDDVGREPRVVCDQGAGVDPRGVGVASGAGGSCACGGGDGWRWHGPSYQNCADQSLVSSDRDRAGVVEPQARRGLLNWLVGRCSEQHCLWSTHKERKPTHADTTTDTREARRPECPPAAAALPRAASPGSPPSRGPTGGPPPGVLNGTVGPPICSSCDSSGSCSRSGTHLARRRAGAAPFAVRAVRRSRGAEHRVVRHPPPKHAFDGRGVAGSPSAPAAGRPDRASAAQATRADGGYGRRVARRVVACRFASRRWSARPPFVAA